MYNIDKTNHTLYKVGAEHKNMLKFDRWYKKKIIESNDAVKVMDCSIMVMESSADNFING